MQSNDRHFSIIVKPVGAACNLRCAYCYYLGKPHHGQSSVMSDEVLERYIRDVIAIHGSDATVEFAWHGGEPTLAGLTFYERAIALQRKYGASRKILNTLQTNATLLDDDWCRFFADNGFMLGVSIDGTEHLHDKFRKDAGGNGTFRKVMRGIELLQKHKVNYNTLTTVNAVNCRCGAEVYQFLRTITDYMQFLPVVERIDTGMGVAVPPGVYSGDVRSETKEADFNVPALEYGKFLCAVFDEWLRKDVGKKFVQIFEATIGNMTRHRAGICVHETVCGHCAAIERNGDTYRCDRYVFPEYRVGNIMREPLREMMESNRRFGEHKLDGLSTQCLHCDVVELCFGGCPKDRFVYTLTPDGVEAQNYLCPGYREFFRYFKSKVRRK